MNESAPPNLALVIGASGLVGSALMRKLGRSAVGTYRTRPSTGLRHLDARDAESTRSLVEDLHPALVYFPAADPNVDWCEEHPAEARAANVAPAVSALASANAVGARLVFFSSDYVFDGRAGPYDEAAATSPVSVYGRLKLEVEEAVLSARGTVIRTTTVFGSETPPGKNFVLRLVARLRSHERVRVPNDQVSTPTWSDELARGAIAVGPLGGIWNVAGRDLLARDEFARLIAAVFDLDRSLIEPTPTSELGQVAPRPRRGGLLTAKLRERIGDLMPIESALASFRASLGAQF